MKLLSRVLYALIFLCIDSSLAADRMSELREQARHRQRRIIYNNDGDDVVIPMLTSVEEFLRQRTGAAMGTHVDSIFYNTCGGTQYHHDTNVGERWDDSLDAIGDSSENGTKIRHNMRFLRSKGTDSLRATITRAREAGLEIFWSHRINDSHDSVLEWPWHLSQWKLKHLEYLMGTPEDAKNYPQSHPKFWWSILDFEKPQVRDYMFRVTEDVCRRYDVDGVEIDYWRYPLFFRPNRDLMPATEEQLDILTGFQRSIRQMAEREGNKRGRPILVAAKVPMSVVACRNVGIDIARWLREDLVDLLILGNGDSWPNLPIEEFVKLGHNYNVPVYPCLKYSGYGHDDIETWRAAASNAWRTGADGLYFFNHCPYLDPSPQFKELGDPEKLATLDKLFAATDLGTNWPYIQTGKWHLGLANVLPSSLPILLKADGGETVVRLEIGDDIAGAAKRKILESAVMKVRLSDSNLLDAVEMRLNGSLLTPTAREPEGGWLTFNPEPAGYRMGENFVVLRLTKAMEDRSTPAQVLAVETVVKYGPPAISRDGKLR